MGKLILETQVSIDGFIADEQGCTDWMIWNWGQEWSWDKKLQDFHTKLITSAEKIVISAQMAREGFNAHWQQVERNSSGLQFQFAHHINTMQKFVVSTKLTKEISIPGGWGNTSILGDDCIEHIRQLKQDQNSVLMVYGGAILVASLIEADLVDEYYLLINPVSLGKGLPIFRSRKPLKMIESIAFDCGVVINHYQRETSDTITPIDKFNDTLDHWTKALAGFKINQLLTKPMDGGWSMGQLYEHILEESNWYNEQIEVSLNDTGHKDEMISDVASELMIRGSFENKRIVGDPLISENVKQPKSIEDILLRLTQLKKDTNALWERIRNNKDLGKSKHPGIGFLNGIEWIRYSEMHMRHHFRQKYRLEQELNF